MNLPIFELLINESMADDAEVSMVALVDRPAIQRNWNAFRDKKLVTMSQVGDRRIISGPLMLSDTPIYRNDHMGEYYVTFSAETILKIAQKYFKRGYQANVNLMHDPNLAVGGVTMFESFVTDSQRGVLAMKGFEDAPQGSWFGSFLVENEEVWAAIKRGEFLGFSVEGLFEYQRAETAEDKLFNEIAKILKQVK